MALVILVLAVFGTLSFLGSLSDSQTTDEAVHLASGYSFLRTRDPRINPEHPPLVKVLCALPLLALDLNDPTLSRLWREASLWQYGREFLYENKAPADRMLLLGRLPVIVLGLAVLLVVYSWSTRLNGPLGGLFSLALAALSPDLLAHSHLVTLDVPLTFGTTLSLYLFATHDGRWNLRSILGFAFALGFALATKVPALQLLPLLGLLAVSDAAAEWGAAGRTGPGNRAKLYRIARSLAKTAFVVAAAALLSGFLLWGTYGFGDMTTYWLSLRNMSRTSSHGHPAYLFGEVSLRGWYRYFLVALAVKLPAASLAAFLLAAVCRVARGHEAAREERHLLLSALFLFTIPTLARLDLGVRYLLPCLPLLCILGGRLAVAHRPGLQRRVPLLLAGLIFLQGTEVLSNHPHYISFFNSLAGGPRAGWKILADSNLDWGQDLRNLARALRSQGSPPVRLAYGGTADPAAYGIRYQTLPPIFEMQTRTEDLLGPEDGLLAISVNHLVGLQITDPGAYRWLWDRRPVATIGHSIFLYDIARDADAHRQLAFLYARTGWNRWAEHEWRIYRGLEGERSREPGAAARP